MKDGIPDCCGYDMNKMHSTIGEGADGYLHRKGCQNGPKAKPQNVRKAGFYHVYVWGASIYCDSCHKTDYQHNHIDPTCHKIDEPGIYQCNLQRCNNTIEIKST